MRFSALAIAALGLAAFTHSAVADEQGNLRLAFNIQAAPLADALEQLSRQTGLQVLHRDAEEGKEPKTPSVKGTLTVQEALDRLLANSGYSYEFVNDRTLRVWEAKPSADDANEKKEEGERPLVLAQSRPREGQAVATQSVARDRDQRTASADHREDAIDQVIVTGTHIRGAGEIPAPIISVNRAEILQSGFTSTQELFANLPQNFAEVTSDSFLAAGNSRLASLNYSRAAGIDLRGLGAGSTLTLINGMRQAGSVSGRVVDVSAIPLAAIERLEIVTGGRSAIYGSDAVAGVVNVLTRRDFSGAETQAAYSRSREGGGRLQASQVVGGSFGAGHVMAAYDYTQDWALDLGGSSLLVSPDETGLVHRRLDTQPDGKRHSILSAGSYDFSDRVKGTFDAMYTSRKIQASAVDVYPDATSESLNFTDDSSDHLSGSVGVSAALGVDWRLDVTGAASRVNSTTFTHQTYDIPAFFFTGDFRDTRVAHSKLIGGSAIASGSFELGGTVPKLAVGVERRQESLEEIFDGELLADKTRQVSSAFIEAQVPVFQDAQRTVLRRVELSLAGRLDHYDDFGDTSNPQFGVLIELVSGLNLRSTFARSFRAPALADLATPGNGIISLAPDPLASSGESPLLVWQGGRPQLDPERARTWTVGFDYRPTSSVSASLSYFNIHYTDRIDIPAVSSDEQTAALVNSAYFPGLILRKPTSAEINALLTSIPSGFISNFSGLPYDPGTQTLLDAFPDLVIFDARTNNIAKEQVHGLDLQLTGAFDAGSARVSSGLNATYTFSHDRNVTTTSPRLSAIDDVGKPVRFKARGNAGITSGALGAFLYVSYMDSYRNSFVVPTGSIASWVTTDLSLSFDGTRSAGGRVLDGIRAALTVHNLFNRDPPTFLNNDLYGIRYDPTNSNPLGRQVSVSFTKSW